MTGKCYLAETGYQQKAHIVDIVVNDPDLSSCFNNGPRLPCRLAGDRAPLAPTASPLRSHLTLYWRPTHLFLPPWQILSLMLVSGPSFVPDANMVTFTATDPSKGTATPPATPRRPSVWFQRSSCLMGCRLSFSLMPVASFALSSFSTSSSVVELTADPPSNIMLCVDSPIHHLLYGIGSQNSPEEQS